MADRDGCSACLSGEDDSENLVLEHVGDGIAGLVAIWVGYGIAVIARDVSGALGGWGGPEPVNDLVFSRGNGRGRVFRGILCVFVLLNLVW